MPRAGEDFTGIVLGSPDRCVGELTVRRGVRCTGTEEIGQRSEGIRDGSGGIGHLVDINSRCRQLLPESGDLGTQGRQIRI